MPTTQIKKSKNRKASLDKNPTQTMFSDRVLHMLDQKIRELDNKSMSMAKTGKGSKQKSSKKRQAAQQPRRCKTPPRRCKTPPVKGILRRSSSTVGDKLSKDTYHCDSLTKGCYFSQESPVMTRKGADAKENRLKNNFNPPFYSVPNMRTSTTNTKDNHVRFEANPSKHENQRNLVELMKNYSGNRDNKPPVYSRDGDYGGRSPSCPRAGLNFSYNKSMSENEWNGVKAISTNLVSKYDNLFLDSSNHKYFGKGNKESDKHGTTQQMKKNTSIPYVPLSGSSSLRGTPLDSDSGKCSFNYKYSAATSSNQPDSSYNKCTSASNNPYSQSALDSRFPGSSKLYQSLALRNNTFGSDFTKGLSPISRSTFGKFTGYTSLLSDLTRERLGIDTSTPMYSGMTSRDYLSKSILSTQEPSYSYTRSASMNNSNIKDSTTTVSGSTSFKTMGSHNSSVDTFLESYLTDRLKKSGKSEKSYKGKTQTYESCLKDYSVISGSIDSLLASIENKKRNPESYRKDPYNKSGNSEKLTDTFSRTTSFNLAPSTTDTQKTTASEVCVRFNYREQLGLSTEDIAQKKGAFKTEIHAPSTTIVTASNEEFKNILERIKSGKSTWSTELLKDSPEKSVEDYTCSGNDFPFASEQGAGREDGGEGTVTAERYVDGGTGEGAGKEEDGGETSKDSQVHKDEGNMLDIMQEQQSRLGDLESMLGKVTCRNN